MPLKTNIFLIFFKDIHLKSIIFLIFCPGLPLKTIIFAYLKRKSNSIFFSIIRLGLGCTFLTTKHLYLNWMTKAAITMAVHEKQEIAKPAQLLACCSPNAYSGGKLNWYQDNLTICSTFYIKF